MLLVGAVRIVTPASRQKQPQPVPPFQIVIDRGELYAVGLPNFAKVIQRRLQNDSARLFFLAVRPVCFRHTQLPDQRRKRQPLHNQRYEDDAEG